MAAPTYLPDTLVILFQGREIKQLRPGDPTFTFGRGSDRDLRFADAGQHVSRNAGSIRWDRAVWLVCNDSHTRPFDVAVNGVANPLPPRTSEHTFSSWAISPSEVEIKIVAPSRRYILRLKVSETRPRFFSNPEAGRGPRRGPSTDAPPEPTETDRLILAAKFLALPDPGDAVGNAEAADYANLSRRRDKAFTDDAVGSCVGRWCARLQELGVTGIAGRENINHLGRQLLAWGVLRQEDRGLLRPPE